MYYLYKVSNRVGMRYEFDHTMTWYFVRLADVIEKVRSLAQECVIAGAECSRYDTDTVLFSVKLLPDNKVGSLLDAVNDSHSLWEEKAWWNLGDASTVARLLGA